MSGRDAFELSFRPGEMLLTLGLLRELAVGVTLSTGATMKIINPKLEKFLESTRDFESDNLVVVRESGLSLVDGGRELVWVGGEWRVR